MGEERFLDASLRDALAGEAAEASGELHAGKYAHVCACVLVREYLSHSVISDSCNPWTVPPSSSVHSIFQARILEWVVISFSRAFSPPRDQT